MTEPPWRLEFDRTPSLNTIISWKTSGRHWRYKALKKFYLQVAESWRDVHRAPQTLAPMRVVVTRHSPRELDLDGLVGGCKPLLDALVRSGWLRGDRPVDVEVAYHQERSRQDLTVVEISPL